MSHFGCGQRSACNSTGIVTLAAEIRTLSFLSARGLVKKWLWPLGNRQVRRYGLASFQCRIQGARKSIDKTSVF